MENKSIYNISKDYLEILHELEDNEGVFTQEMETALAINEKELKEKALAYIPVVKSIEMEQKEIDTEIKRLQAIKKVRANMIAGLKERLSNALKTYGIDEIKTATNKISFRKSEKTIISDVELLPDDCIIIEKKPISATELKKQIKSGRDIPGVELVQSDNIQIK